MLTWTRFQTCLKIKKYTSLVFDQNCPWELTPYSPWSSNSVALNCTKNVLLQNMGIYVKNQKLLSRVDKFLYEVQHPAQGFTLARSFQIQYRYHHQTHTDNGRTNDVSSNTETGVKTRGRCLATHTTFCPTGVGASRFLLLHKETKSIFSGTWPFPLCVLAEWLFCASTCSARTNKPSLPGKEEKKQRTSVFFSLWNKHLIMKACTVT